MVPSDLWARVGDANCTRPGAYGAAWTVPSVAAQHTPGECAGSTTGAYVLPARHASAPPSAFNVVSPSSRAAHRRGTAAACAARGPGANGSSPRPAGRGVSVNGRMPPLGDQTLPPTQVPAHRWGS